MAKEISGAKGGCCSGHKCMGCSLIWLIVGGLLVLNNLLGWGWNIDPVSVLILLVGLHMLCKYKMSASCK